MFERFTEKAIKVIMLAQEEARRIGIGHVATEQILLGLIGEASGIGGKTLMSLKINLKDARTEVERTVGTKPPFAGTEIPFTPGAKQTLEYAWDEARQLGVNYIGTEHLLLGLIRVDQDYGVKVLEKLGVNVASVKSAVIENMDQTLKIYRPVVLEMPPFDRLTDDALMSFVLAREETRRLGQSSVTTGLLLLGLIAEGSGPAARILSAHGVTLSDASKAVEKVVGRGAGVIPVHSPLADMTGEVFKAAYGFAVRVSHGLVSGEHLLLALIDVQCSETDKVLTGLKLDVAKLTARCRSALAESSLSKPSATFNMTRNARIENAWANAMQQADEQLSRFRSGTARSEDLNSHFARFTEKAIKVVMHAQEESRRLGHNFVGTEQILLGILLEKTGFAGVALESQGITVEAVRREVEKIIGRGSGFVSVEIPFTPRSKRVIELSWEEAQKLGRTYIGTEHLLLGLLREGEGVAGRVLEILNANPDKLQAKINELVSGGGAATV